MPINGINGTSSILLSALVSRQRDPLRPTAGPTPDPANPAPAEAPAPPAENTIQQNVLGVNETPQDFGVEPRVGEIPQPVPPAAQAAIATAAEIRSAVPAVAPSAEYIPVVTPELAAAATPATTPPTPTAATPAPPVPLVTAFSIQELAAATVPPTPLPGEGTVNTLAAPQVNAPPPPVENAVQQNVLLVTETLRNLDFSAAAARDTLLVNTSSFLTALQATQELTPEQESALQINETLQNLSFVPPEPANILLINELPPALEVAEFAQELDLVRQTSLRVNETLRDLGIEPRVAVEQQPLSPAAQQAAAVPTEATMAVPPAPAASAEIIPVTDEGLAATTVAVAVAPTVTAPTPTVASPEPPVPLANLFPPRELSPATMPVTQAPYRAPGAFAVYLINDLAPPPGPPAPPSREVPRTIPIAGIHPVANSRLRQMLLRGGKGGQPSTPEYNAAPAATIVQAEKSIRYSLAQVNADMEAHNLPLHFVFAKHGDGFALDVYDCSFDDSCRLSYDIPVQLDKLTEVLHNLDDEKGIIVDTSP